MSIGVCGSRISGIDAASACPSWRCYDGPWLQFRMLVISSRQVSFSMPVWLYPRFNLSDRDVEDQPFTTPILRRFSFRGVLGCEWLYERGGDLRLRLSHASDTRRYHRRPFVHQRTHALDAIHGARHDRPRRHPGGLDEWRQHPPQYCPADGDGYGYRVRPVAFRIAGLFDLSASGVIPLANFHIAFVIAVWTRPRQAEERRSGRRRRRHRRRQGKSGRHRRRIREIRNELTRAAFQRMIARIARP
jgi:hypothetical protein